MDIFVVAHGESSCIRGISVNWEVCANEPTDTVGSWFQTAMHVTNISETPDNSEVYRNTTTTNSFLPLCRRILSGCYRGIGCQHSSMAMGILGTSAEPPKAPHPKNNARSFTPFEESKILWAQRRVSTSSVWYLRGDVLCKFTREMFLIIRCSISNGSRISSS